MSRLSEKTIEELNDKVDFKKAFTAVDSLYEARSHLNDEVIDDLERLVKKLDAITGGAVDEEGDELFDMADELESDILAAQEHLENIYDVLSSITECWPNPDEEYEEENDESE
jgi:DNA-binding transcriptional regulator GbsR (MarR family)